jgi:sulfoxide reductase heme-binding subunit YedZ
VLRKLIGSHVALWLLLLLPAAVMLWQFFFGLRSWGLLLDQSGEWAVRLLILTLAVTPVRLLMKQMGLADYWDKRGIGPDFLQ